MTGVTSRRPIRAAVDNFDQIEETLDGKHTTHAVATVVCTFGYKSTEADHVRRSP